jgi:NitT/TauT family transport system permease protein
MVNVNGKISCAIQENLILENRGKKHWRYSLLQAFIPMGRIPKTYTILLATAAFVGILGLWFSLTLLVGIDAFFLPSPVATLDAARILLSDGEFVLGVQMTVFRVMMGFSIAAAVAVPMGLLIGTYAPASAMLEYVFSFVRYLPASAFIPLFILWIGIDEPEKIAVIILGSLPQLVLMVATNVRNVPMSMIEVSYTLGTSKADVLWKIILPKALPDIVDSLRTVLGWAWTYIIVAELVGASSGIGYMIIQSQRMMNTSRIFVGILTIGLIGMIIDIAFKVLHDYFFYWNKEVR